GEAGRDAPPRSRVTDRLAAVALVVGAVRGLHDLRLRVGEVALRLRLRLERIAPVRRPPRLLSLRLQLGAARPLGRARLRLERLLRLANPLQPLLAPLEVVGRLIPAAVPPPPSA